LLGRVRARTVLTETVLAGIARRGIRGALGIPEAVRSRIARQIPSHLRLAVTMKIPFPPMVPVTPPPRWAISPLRSLTIPLASLTADLDGDPEA